MPPGAAPQGLRIGPPAGNNRGQACYDSQGETALPILLEDLRGNKLWQGKAFLYRPANTVLFQTAGKEVGGGAPPTIKATLK